MIGMKSPRVVIVVVIALASVACSEASVSGGAGVPTPSAPTSTTLAPDPASAPAATPEPSPTPTPEIGFRALDTPADYSRSGAEAVDGTTAVGWVQVGLNDEQPAVWDTTTGALRVLDVPAEFVHPSGDTFVRLVGVSGTTAVGTGVLGTKGERGQDRAMAWDTQTGDLRTLDIPADTPADFTRSEARAISGTTAVGQVWTRDGEVGAAVAWDTETGAVRLLEMPPGHDCGDPRAISGDTVVGIRCGGEEALPLVWSPLTADARDLELLPATQDGVPWAVDGTMAVGWCCIGEEGTPLPLIWDTAAGSVRQLTLPAPVGYGRAYGVGGTVAVGSADSTPVVWDLETGEARVLPAPAGYDASYAAQAVSGRTIVGSACEPPASTSENPRCVAAAWTLP
jgi:hypothetical protein